MVGSCMRGESGIRGSAPVSETGLTQTEEGIVGGSRPTPKDTTKDRAERQAHEIKSLDPLLL